MEILIVVAIWTVVVKRGVEDIIHTVKGGTPPRYAAAKARRKSGAAGRYWGQLWEDSWESMLQRHNRRVAARADKPQGPTVADRWKRGWMLLRYARWNAQNRFKRAMARRDERRRTKATRPRPEPQTVPGTVVPNRPAQDGDETTTIHDERQDDTRPRDEDRPGPEPRIVPTEDGTDLQFGADPTDPTGIRLCPECEGQLATVGRICPSCLARQEQRNQHHDNPLGPVFERYLRRKYPDPDEVENPSWEHWQPIQTNPTQAGDEQGSPDTQEGPTTMTTTTPEVTGLEPAITFCETSAQAYNAMVGSIEQTMAALQAGDVTGPARDAFAAAMEQSAAAATSMETAAAELRSHRIVAEAYDAATGAGTREFVRGGR